MIKTSKIKKFIIAIASVTILCGFLYNGEESLFTYATNNVQFSQPLTVEQLRQADPKQLASLDRYDGRIYGTDGVNGIVPPIENQANKLTCWSYATIATAEISILREGLWDQKTQGVLDLWEDNNAFVTLNNDGSTDPLGLNNDDKFNGEWNDGLNAAYSVQRMLSSWKSPTFYEGNGNIESYKDADFKLDGIIWADHKDINSIKYAVAKYGAVTISYEMTSYASDYYFNGNAGTIKGGHVCTIVGWDDTIDKNKYRIPATTNGGWIVRNSWGNYNGNGGYFYMSYDTKIRDTYALDFAPKYAYDYNYHYDSYGANYDANFRTNKVANVFPVRKSTMEKTEKLKAVNVGVNTPDTTITVDIYTGVQADDANIFSKYTNPESGVKVCSVTKKVDLAGNYTIELPQPVELEAGEFFSVVATVENANDTANVMMSNEGTRYKNDMSYYKDANGKWNCCSSVVQGVALRIKAFTIIDDRQGVENLDLKYTTAKLKGNPTIRYGEDTSNLEVVVEYEGTPLVKDVDYVVKPVQNDLNPPAETTYDTQPIGTGSIEIVATGKWKGKTMIKFPIIVGFHNLDNLGIATKNGKAIFEVGKDVNYYSDIPLPNGWVWTYPTNKINFGENTDNYIDYKGSDSLCYRKNMYDAIVNKTEQTTTKIDVGNSVISLDKTEYLYSSNKIEPIFTVTLNGEKLTNEIDFTSEFTNNINVGTATLTIRGMGKYFGEKTLTFQIVAANISQAKMTVIGDYFYSGKEIIPSVQLVFNEKILVIGVDYNITYLNNINAGIGNIVVTGKGNYIGEVQRTFTINKAPNEITGFTIDNGEPKATAKNGVITYKYYADSECIVEIEKPIVEGIYYVKAYASSSENWESAESTVLVLEIKGEYIDISNANISLSNDTFVYNGSPFTPNVVVIVDGITLVQNINYGLSYSNNVNAGIGVVTILGKGNYIGEVQRTFTINKAPNEIMGFTIDNGEPKATAKYGVITYKYYADSECIVEIEKPIVEGIYYVKAYASSSENWESAESKVLVLEIKGEYIDISNANILLSNDTFVYNGSPFTPNVVVIVDGITLVQNINYALSYSNNVNAGIGVVTILGKGNYIGEVQRTFTISKAPNEITGFAIDNGEPKATAKYGVITYKYYADSECIVEIEKPIVEGIYYVKAYASSSENWESAESKVLVLEIKGEYIDISNANILLSNDTFVYNGSPFTPNVVVIVDGITLVQNINYALSYSNNVNAGIGVVTILGKGNYIGEVQRTFTINKAPNEIMGFTIDNGEPKATAKYGVITYKYYADSECIVEIEKPIVEGIYYVKAYASSSENWESAESKVLVFEIKGEYIDISNAIGKVDGDKFVYNGKAYTPNVSIVLNGRKLVKGEDYLQRYENNVNAGRATAIIRGIGKYKGEIRLYFTIEKAKSQIVDFDIVDGNPVANATLGEVTYKYYADSECKNEIDKPLAPGKYYVKAIIYGTDDFSGVESTPIAYVIDVKTIEKNGLDGGAITAIAICSVILVLTAGLVIAFVVKKRNK